MNIKLNIKRAKFFENPHHAKKDKAFFTSDDTAFTDEQHATAQGIALAREAGNPDKGGFDVVTRAEYEEWKASFGAAQDDKNSDDAKKPNLGLLKGAITRCQNGLTKATEGGNADAIAAAEQKLKDAQQAYADAGGVA